MFLLNKIKNYQLILATQSPRRHLLMRDAGFDFKVVVPEGIEEIFPENTPATEVPEYLAKLKASWFNGNIAHNEVVITADTIVILHDEVIGKPTSANDAIHMLSKLSGNMHHVVTGVCFTTHKAQHTFSAVSKVYFRHISSDEIQYYVNTFKPFDKAGSYGAQEWIGFVGIEGIEGSYFNVMGLPIQNVYTELDKFLK